MATLKVCSRISTPINRFQVTLGSLDDSVATLKKEISKNVGGRDDSFDVVYAGLVLQQGKKVSDYNLQHRSTVYVLNKFSPSDEKNATEAPAGQGACASSKHEVLMSLRTALLQPDYRNIVERMLTNPETIDNIIAATPGLDKDPAVLSMLPEQEMLAVLTDPSNIDSLMRAHPAFAQTAVTVATAVNEEGAKKGMKGGAVSLTYSMDQMSDEEDDVPEGRQRAQGSGMSITASQLAAALQAATGARMTSRSNPPVGVMPSASHESAGPSSSGSTITNDFFQQAMAHAQSASNEGALQQLRDMGITDENVARQALAATGGDIQAAIDLIFGDGFM